MKKRIVGAAVLISLVVILLPLAFKGPVERTVEDVPLVRPLTPFETLTKPVSQPPALPTLAEPALTPEPLVSESFDATPVSSLTLLPSEKPASSAEPAPTPHVKPAIVLKKEIPPSAVIQPKVTEGWVVQVGSFSSQDKAEALQAVLRKSDLDTAIQKVKIGEVFYFRVRLMPPANKAAAEEKAGHMRQLYKLKTLVVRHEG